VSLFVQLDKLLKVIYPNKLTLRGYLVELRKPLKDAKWDQAIAKQSSVLMGMSREESAQEAEKYQTQVKARNMARGSMVPIYVEDLYNLMDNLIQSQNPYELSLAVEIATGSRSIELFKVSEYKEVMNYPKQISVIGIAKDKSGNNLQNVVLTRNLVHLDSKQVINAVEKIRQLLNVTGDNKKISQRTNKHLNNKQREFVIPLIEKNATVDEKKTEEYKNYIDKFTSHHNRYLFANVSWLIYAKNKNIPLNVYAQEQLGHLGAGSTNSYLGINVKFRNNLIKNADPEIKQYIESVEKKVNKLQREVDLCCDDSTDLPNLRNFKNSFSRAEPFDSKVKKVVDAINLIKSKKKVRMLKQSELGRLLGFGSEVMSAGYQKAREEGIINNFNTTKR
jgi:hypothetical protein